jgi:hypothetical protein
MGKNNALELSKKFVDFLTPDAQAEKLIFRRYPGKMLHDAAAYGEPIDEKKIDKIILKINPRSINFTKAKVIQKVQTSAPDRFIVFDWGHELTIVAIEGVTGNLLPDSLTKGVLDPVADATMEALAWSPGTQQDLRQNEGWKSFQNVSSQMNSIFNDITLGTMTYSELLELSPKYKTFKRLEKIYDDADADDDIITLELGNTIYRGFFEQFNFAISAESPWNWTYNLVFVILSNLTEKVNKLDPTYTDKERKTVNE